MARDEKKEKKKPRFGGGGGALNGDDIVEDERFASMHRDPRFMAMPRKQTTVEIDERFAGVFNDPNFAAGGGAGGVDKRGRRVTSKSGAKMDARTKQIADMKAYYKMEGEDSDDEDEAMDEKMEKSMDRMRGIGLESSSEEESDSEDEDELEDEEEGVLPTMLVGEADKDIPTIDATRRLAIVNCEWQHIRACDLFAVLRSFTPKGGSLERVSVYPSDFGLERMAVENKFGPLSAFQKDESKKAKTSSAKKVSGDDGDEGDAADNEQMRQYERDRLRYYYAIAEFDCVKTAMGVYHECDGIEYERSSFKLDLRYVPDDQTFEGRQVRDSATDIPADYEAPEFQVKALQHSNVKLSWDDDDPARRKTFRRKVTEENLKDEDFAAYLASDSEEEESESEEEPENAKAAKKAYLAKLLGGSGAIDEDDEGDGADEKDDFFMSDDDDGEDTAKASTMAFKKKRDKERYGSKTGDGDMEVTFHAGLEEFGARIKKKQKEGKLGVKETVYEKQERLRKEKREAKRLAKKKGEDVDDADEFDDGEEPPATFDDPFFMDDGGDVDFDAEYDSEDGAPEKKKKASKFDDDDTGPSKTSLKKAKKKAKRGEIDEQAQADLELLMMDEKQILGKSDGITKKTSAKNDADEPKKKKSKKERLAEKRRLRGKAARRAESDDEDDGEANKLDTTDDRFAGLYESHHFSLDPTDPRYKDVQNKKLIISERDKRRKTKADKSSSKAVSALHSEAKEIGSSELQNMLSSLKRKSKTKK